MTKDLVAKGELKVAGIVQEQHPDRAVLYMQWQKMEWPVLADPFNELGIKVVPITLLIDESGVIRFKNPRRGDLKKFLATEYPRTKAPESMKAFGGTIESLRKDSKNARSQFQLGVAYRQRFDSEEREPEDFSRAIEAWGKALSLNPDQYIWRRRIQQYGPRLDKPYSFYDWVNQARKEILARGEKPHELKAEPGGSEFAYPVKRGRGEKSAAVAAHPDPEGKVRRDEGALVQVQTTVVPSTKGDGKAVRVHLHFLPNSGKEVHWTNDAGQLSFHLKEDAGFTIHDFSAPGKVPAELATAEGRAVEFEVRPAPGKKLPKSIDGTAFYYVCLGSEGECQYLGRDLTILLK